jgi:hypothetical protein
MLHYSRGNKDKTHLLNLANTDLAENILLIERVNMKMISEGIYKHICTGIREVRDDEVNLEKQEQGTVTSF